VPCQASTFGRNDVGKITTDRRLARLFDLRAEIAGRQPITMLDPREDIEADHALRSFGSRRPDLESLPVEALALADDSAMQAMIAIAMTRDVKCECGRKGWRIDPVMAEWFGMLDDGFRLRPSLAFRRSDNGTRGNAGAPH
jgi:hypothetical protein